MICVFCVTQVAVLDSNGMVVPSASDNVTFTVSGEANLIGTGNGDPADHTADKSASRSAFHGLVAGSRTSEYSNEFLYKLETCDLSNLCSCVCGL